MSSSTFGYRLFLNFFHVSFLLPFVYVSFTIRLHVFFNHFVSLSIHSCRFRNLVTDLFSILFASHLLMSILSFGYRGTVERDSVAMNTLLFLLPLSQKKSLVWQPIKQY